MHGLRHHISPSLTDEDIQNIHITKNRIKNDVVERKKRGREEGIDHFKKTKAELMNELVVIDRNNLAEEIWEADYIRGKDLMKANYKHLHDQYKKAKNDLYLDVDPDEIKHRYDDDYKKMERNWLNFQKDLNWNRKNNMLLTNTDITETNFQPWEDWYTRKQKLRYEKDPDETQSESESPTQILRRLEAVSPPEILRTIQERAAAEREREEEARDVDMPPVQGTGGEVAKILNKPGKDGVTNVDIDRMMHGLRMDFAGYKGACCWNEVANKNWFTPGRPCSFIMNLDPSWSSKGGTHWVAVYIDPRPKPQGTNSIEYFDSFGRPASDGFKKELKKIVKKLNPAEYLKLKENKVTYQFKNSDTCGLMCIKFLYDRIANGKKFAECSGFNRAKQEEHSLRVSPIFKKFIHK